MNDKSRYLILGGLIFVLAWTSPSAFAQSIAQIQPPKVSHEGNILRIEAVFESSQPLLLYYKPAEIDDYQCRPMTEESKSIWACLIETETLFGERLEYYIQPEGDSGANLSPLFSLDLSFLNTASMPDEAPPPPPPSSPFLRIGATLSGDFFLTEGGSQESQVVNKVDINGNFRIYRNITDGDTQVDLDATLSYLTNHAENEPALNLQTMIIRFKNNNHLFEMGDLTLNYSEHSAAYLNRRGLQYGYTSQSLNFGAFWANAQQKTGFNGLGFPPAKGMLMGASAGVNLAQRILLQGVFITGKDDQTSKTLYNSEDAYREGHLISFFSTIHVIPGRWSLDGEYSSSSFGTAASDDDLVKEPDTAWKAGTSLNLGPVSGRIQYQELGQNFNSIANQFLQNDRRGLMGSLAVNQGSFSLNISYQDQQTFMHHPTQPSQHSRNLGTQLNWLIANHFNLGGEFALDNLEYDASTGLHTGGEGMKTIRGALFVGYVSGANSITFRAGKTESQTFTSNLDASVAVNLRFGNVFTLAPTVSFQRTQNLSDESNSDILSLFATGELSFIPNLATISFTGSYSQSKNPYADSDSMSLGANANLYLASLFNNKIQPAISLRGQYQKGTYNTISSDYWTLFLHADLSF